MCHLVKSALAVFTTLVLLCISAIIIGQIQPMGSIVPGLDTYQGRLSYIGITVGQTTWAEAQEIIKNTPGLTLSTSPYGADIANGPTRKLILFYDTNHTIFEEDLIFRPSTVPLISILAHWGRPCAVYSMRSNSANIYALVLRYSNVVVWTNPSSDLSIQPFSAVAAVELYRGNPSNIFPCNGSLENALRYNWRGFTY